MNKSQLLNLTIQRLTNANSGGLLPAEYQQVEYIQSSGTQHIVTSVPIASNVETRCKGMIYTGSLLYGALVGGRNNNNNNGRYVPFSTTKGYSEEPLLRFVYGNTELRNTENPYNVLYEIIYNDADKNVYCNNVLLGTYTGKTISTSGQQNIALFGMSGYNGANVDWKATGRLYYASFYDNRTGDVIADYIPCYRKSDNKPGMYDIVTNTFFTNAGTGDFAVGNNV